MNQGVHIVRRCLLFCLAFFPLLACKKNVIESPPHTTIYVSNLTLNFTVSQSQVVLIQDNASLVAFSLKWDPSKEIAVPGTMYTIESSIDGTNFEDMVEIATTDKSALDIHVEDFNRKMSGLIPSGYSGMIQLRVRANLANSTGVLVYSNAVALQVTTYQPFINYDLPMYMHVPGNYQNWDITDAPHIVSTMNNGEYEGYINFTEMYSQFFLVKATQWIPSVTYGYMGGDKFGPGGSVLTIFGGTGVYLLRANTNTSTWSSQKINSWGIHGTALPAVVANDPVMTFDSARLSWKIQTHLVQGNFRIRANNIDAISFGKTMSNGYLVPSYTGDDFVISKAGNYTVILNLKLAGNYNCSLIKNPTDSAAYSLDSKKGLK